MLSEEELETVSGGEQEFLPEQIQYARFIVEAYRNNGYTQDEFIKVLDENTTNRSYRKLYLDIWDNKL